jgi:hypothetical protein
MHVFCTYCDKGYAARMRCLHESLKAQGEPFRLLVLCFDSETEAVVAAAGDPSLVGIPLTELLAADPEFAAVRAQRSRVEFFFTSTPVLVRHCFAREPAAGDVTYLDADLFFFAPASAVFAEQGDASIGIVPHRFLKHTADDLRHGAYNVGWVSFRRDPNGLACVNWWRERCLEWCYDRIEDGRFADQGYLDEFPRRFAGVCAIEHPGVNAAPWNVNAPSVALKDGRPWVGDHPVLFYHFQGVREVAEGWFDPGLRTYRQNLTRGLRDWIYVPYLKRLTAMQEKLRRLHGIVPVRGYLRVPASGGGWSGRWERFRAGGIMAAYRRLRGRLLYCPEPAG